MTDKEKPQDMGGFKEGQYDSHPATSDHRTLVSALKEAFGKSSDPTEVKVGMDETIPNGKYMVRGQLVNAHGEPIDENGKVLKRD
jgi:hypothetical protein